MEKESEKEIEGERHGEKQKKRRVCERGRTRAFLVSEREKERHLIGV